MDLILHLSEAHWAGPSNEIQKPGTASFRPGAYQPVKRLYVGDAIGNSSDVFLGSSQMLGNSVGQPPSTMPHKSLPPGRVCWILSRLSLGNLRQMTL